MQQRGQNTRARLLDSALRQFAVKGYDATSVDDICEVANVSKGAFYHHFESKHAVFLTLLNSWLQVIEHGLQEFQEPTVPKTLLAMTEILPDILTAASDRLPMFLEFWLHASRDAKIWEASIEPYQHFRGYFAEVVARGTKEGSLRAVNPEIASQVILSMVLGILLQALLEPERADWGQSAKHGMEIMMKGLAR